jgi:hypothetical protein
VQVGNGCRDVKKGSSGFPLRLFRNSSPPQLECKEPCFVHCRLPGLAGWLAACLPAAPRTRKHPDHGCSPLVRSAGWQAAQYLRWQVQVFLFPTRVAGFEGDVSAGYSRGLYRPGCTVFVSCRQVRCHGWASQDCRRASRTGTCQSARRPLRRMCFCRRDRTKIDSSQCIGTVRPAGQSRRRGLRPPQYGTASTVHEYGADGSFARETWIIVVQLNNRASESDH